MEKTLTSLPGLYIDDTPKMGRGVFTSRPITRGTTVEISPVIVMTTEERSLLDRTRLHDYIFEWGEPDTAEKKCCMALGYIAIYNHAVNSNCEYEMDLGNQTIAVHAMRDIVAGEELFINYNGDWDNPAPVWFEEAGK